MNNRGRARRLKLILSEDGNVLSASTTSELVMLGEDFVLKSDKVVNNHDANLEGVEIKTVIEQEGIKPNENWINTNETIACLIKNVNILVKISIVNYQVTVKQFKWNEDKTLTIAKELFKRTGIRVAVIVKHDRIA